MSVVLLYVSVSSLCNVCVCVCAHTKSDNIKKLSLTYLKIFCFLYLKKIAYF